MSQASRDSNRVPTIIGVSSLDLETPTLIAVNPTTGAVMVDGTSLYANLDTRYLQISNDLSDLANAATARTNLGVAIGSDVQAWDTQLDDIAALAVTDGNFIVGDGANWVAESGATARTSLGLVAGGAGDIWVEKAGDTMTGALTLSGDPTEVLHAATKQYVDALDVGANAALSNLASVAINTSLISDTDSTDDLGSSAKFWRNLYIDEIYIGDAKTVIDYNSEGIIKIRNTDNATAALKLGILGDATPYFSGTTAGSLSQIWFYSSIINTTNFRSDNDSVDDLGDSTHYWAETYTDKLFLNATATLDGATAGLVNITGNISCVGGAHSEKFGILAAVAGAASVAFGKSSSAGGASAVAMGYGAGASATYSIAIGRSSSSTANWAIAVGEEAIATGANSVVVGTHATCAAKINATVVGDSAAVTDHNATAIGKGSSAGVEGVALGMGATSSGSNAFAMGRGAVAGARQCVFGDETYYFSDMYIGEGVTSAFSLTAPSTITIHASGGSGTDIAGAGLQLAGGKGTGTGAGGDLIFLTATPGSTGSTLNTLVERMRIDDAGNVGIGLTPTANMSGLSVEAGLLTIKETTAPTADTNYGKLWTNTSNELWLQDGAGANHLLHGDAFSHIWFHSPNTVEVTISAQDTFTKIGSFTVVGNEDDALNVVGSVSTNDLTLSASGGGEYEISYHGSVTATGGADKDMMVALGITLATPKDITDVTDDTVSPIVITSTAHGLKEGDMVEIVGVLGNDAANGSFIVDNETANTFEIVALDGTATTGDGDFDAGSPTGDVTIVYPGNMVVHRTVRGADPGAISATGLHILANSDVLALYVANLVGTTNLTVLAVSLDAIRVGD